MDDDYESCRKQCAAEHEQWMDEYHTWMDEHRYWKDSEQMMVGIIYELESALPAHRVRLEQFNNVITDDMHLLEAHSKRCTEIRPAYIDEQCPAELKAYQQIGVSRCRDCTPQCIDGLLESHRKAAQQHRQMADEYARLKKEFETAVPQLQVLASRLQAFLNVQKKGEDDGAS